MKDFGRVITAMVTPFAADESLDLNKAKELAKYLVANGSDALVVAGTTGESPTLTKDEKVQLFAAVKEAVGDVPVIAGTGSNCTKDTIELSKKAKEVGADGLLGVVPYYNKPSQEGLYQHFATLAENVDLPIMLYNIPGRTGVNMEVETVARLAEIDNITSIKAACGNLDQVTRLKMALDKDFRIYSGDDMLTLPILSVGGYGIVSVAGHLVGKRIAEMIECFLAGKVEEANAIHLELYPLFKMLFVTTNPVPVKYAVSKIGIETGTFRLPMVEPSDSEKAYIDKVLKDYCLI